MISRRGFLKLGLGGAAAVAGAAGAARGWAWWRGVSFPAGVVLTRLDYLTVDLTGLEAFAADYAPGVRPQRRRLFQAASLLGPFYPTLRAVGYGAELEALETHICESFLLSSDFFAGGARTDRPVRYVALYDPPRTGCQNPFARFDVEIS